MRRVRSARPLQSIQRALCAAAAFLEDVGVDHRCADVCVAEQLLDGAEVVAVFEEVGRERVAKGVARCAFGDFGELDRAAQGFLHGGFVEVMASPRVATRIA